MSDDNNSFEISRRKTLAALGTVGAASAGAGLGTSAWFSDTETFEGNTITAGELDLKVDWRQTYTGPNGKELVNAYPADNGEGMNFECSDLESGDDLPEDVFGEDQDHLIELDDVKPGDEGEITFSLHICDNPGYLWMTLENLVQGPGETPEPEPGQDEGELAENLYLEIWKESDCNNVHNDGEPTILGEGDGVHEEPVTLAQAMEELTYEDGMIVLSGGDGLNGWNIPAGAASRNCFEGDQQHCIGVRWWVPETVGNVIQGDTLEFDLGFYTEQCRHNEGCEPRDIGLNTGDGGWEITAGPQDGEAVVQTPHAEWLTPSEECAWIAPPDDGNTDANGDQDPQGTYTFETDFEVDLQETPAGGGPCRLKFDAATDNTATLYLDGEELGEITGPSSEPEKGFKALETFDKEITAGEHTLVAEVENAETGGSGYDNPVGLLVCGGITCNCEEEQPSQNN